MDDKQKTTNPRRRTTMVETMTQATKDRIAELERQKIDLNDQLEMLGYSGNLVRMHKIEEEIYEIEDTIKKLIK